MELHAGQRINANVELTKPLGRGGMASVWAAHHRTLRTAVAVKFVDASLARSDPSLLTRFEREASTAAQIKSPHVVQMLDHGVTGGWPYIVMELLEGESLEERLCRTGRMSLADVDAVLRQCAKALTRAHALGIIHRDLKPANLFLIDSGYDIFVKVLDFGIAKCTGFADIEAVTASMAVIGTPRYMSLEQLVDTKNVTHRTDLWALAVIAYRALTGALPFDADTLPALTMRVLEGDFKPPSAHHSQLPGSLDAWFARAFARDPGARFESAAALASAFHEAVRGAPIQQVPIREAANAQVPHPSAAYGSTAVAPKRTVLSTPSPTQFAQPMSAGSGSTVSALTSSPRPEASSGRVAAVIASILALTAIAAAVVVWRTTESSAPSTGASSFDVAPTHALVRTGAPSAVAARPTASSRMASTSASAPSPSSDPSSVQSSAARVPAWPGRPTRARPSPPQPAPAPVATPAPVPKSPRCDGNNAFYRDARGRLVARPECL